MEVLDAAGKLSENDVKRLANLRVTHRVLLKKKKAQEEAVRCAASWVSFHFAFFSFRF